MTHRHARRTVSRAMCAGGLVVVLSLLMGCGAAVAEPDPTAPTGSPSASASSTTSPPTAGSDPETPGATTVPSTPADLAGAEEAAAALATLPVRGRAPQTGYSRAEFGQAWSDDVTVDSGHNGCDTRNDVLRRDIRDAQIKPGTQGCVVLSGTLADPYTGTVVPFLRGAQTSDDVQIDHVVALSDAWQTGAQQLSAEQRQNLANDPDNLQATLGWLNQQKGSGDAATWLPPNKSYRCTYVARQIQVKARYQLWVKPAERDAMAGILDACRSTSTTRAISTTVTSVPVDESQGETEPFRNCAAARAAGAAPVYAGQPGYSTNLDGDLDGIACE